MPPIGRPKQVGERRIELCGDGMQDQHGWIIDTAFESPHYVNVNTCFIGERLLTQIQLPAPVAHFHSQTA